MTKRWRLLDTSRPFFLQKPMVAARPIRYQPIVLLHWTGVRIMAVLNTFGVGGDVVPLLINSSKKLLL